MHCKDGDAVLMIEDGVFGALNGSGVAEAVVAKSGSVSVYALTGDVAARGLEGKTLSEVENVDYAGFVDLVTKHDRTQNWL